MVAAITAAALMAPAASANASTTTAACDLASCVRSIEHKACTVVADAMGWQCIDGRSTSTSRSCTRPVGYMTGCLEGVICGAPHNVAVAAGIDEYIDPRLNCIE